MKVTIVESGGFVGSDHAVVSLDTDRLDPTSADRAHDLVGRLEALGEVGADLPGHRIEIHDERGARSFTVVDDGTGNAATGPLDELISLAGA